MSISPNLEAITSATIALIGEPFQWCPIPGGSVHLEDASGPNYDLMRHKGTSGGTYQVADFAMAKYPITNAQYQRFIDAPMGQANSAWWDYSAAARQFRKDRPKPHPTAFAGHNHPRSRVSWFDSMAFCAWLSAQLEARDDIATGHQFKIELINTWCVRLPTEQEWQRAAVGDSGWPYPWGDRLEQTHANYGDNIGRKTAVDQYPSGQSPFGVTDMVGNLAEWLLTRWGEDSIDVSGYRYRGTRGSAWNVATPEYLRAIDRNGWSPRGRLNDAGFRCAYYGA
ncbi:MAG: SUMF1/EgtB/PvdO family nonheme iron enzyme [Caldilineaceae bacterium]|nr:SUMF1/EgtB/PvdO family nonheme iron enzyme [Caldilineaceae bacterium]